MEVEKEEYLDFVELGEFLKELAYQEVAVSFEKRHVHSTLVEEGKINLLAIDAGMLCIFSSVMIIFHLLPLLYVIFSIYMESTFISVYG